MASQTITPTEHDKREWSRMAQAAYSASLNGVGHRYSGWAAKTRIGEAISLGVYDTLQHHYREWLASGKFPQVA